MKCFNLLIIEDDETLGPALQAYLENHNFHVVVIQTGDLINRFELDSLDLIVLDLILPGMPGERVLAEIKRKRPDIPVLVLTSKCSIASKQECFEKGADDYLTKPFDLLEMLLRINALLRRFQKADVVMVNGASIDLTKKIIEKDGSEIAISGRAWDLLAFLVKNRGSIIDKSEILKNVWHETYVSDDSIRYYIKELRKVLSPEAIQTYKGRGYRLI